EGRSLAELIRLDGPLPVAVACDYVRQAALGLHCAHERGLVHRDVKPHNLMLSLRGEVKVLDFGLAKAVREAPDDGQTAVGALMGTPAYMAPEQAGDAKSADVRADVYSLGCTLYHLLTGQPPFSGPTPLAVLQAHQQESAPSLAELRREVPPALAELA